MKDYYKIMDVAYDASPAEIRSAYHRQAKKYHPDKNPGNNSAASAFLEVQEAYLILSDEERRQHFHLRSKYPFTSRQKTPDETTDTILNKVRKLNQLLKEIDIFRMNRTLLYQAILLLLSEKNMNILTTASNPSINRLIVEEVLYLCRILSYREVLKMSGRLLLLAGHDAALQKAVYHFVSRKRVRNSWDKYNLIIIGFITLIICLLILIIST